MWVNLLRALIALSIVLCVSSSFAQNKVVVIPMFGDDAASKWRGEWAEGTAYKAADIVEEGGSSYIAVADHTASLSNIPPDLAFWELIAASGANGMDGAQGPQGIQGPPGQDSTSAVTSVNGEIGDVVLDTDDVTEGANLYYTDNRADGRITAQKGVANGIASLDAGGKVPASQLPPAIPTGTNPGDLLYWDGGEWLVVPAPDTDSNSLSHCNGVPTWTSGICPDGYAIGDTGPAGGIVFYTTDGGLHGLEAAPADSADAFWGCRGTIAGADGTAIGTGAQNTSDIVAGCVSDAEVTAAEVAHWFILNGFSDWFLPSKDELNQLYLQKDVVGEFASSFYWSSSEVGIFAAWYQNFANGYQYDTNSKVSTLHVRPVRAF